MHLRAAATPMFKVRAHSRIEGNKRADSGANMAATRDNEERKLDINYKPAYQQDTFEIQIKDSDNNSKPIKSPTSRGVKTGARTK